MSEEVKSKCPKITYADLYQVEPYTFYFFSLVIAHNEFIYEIKQAKWKKKGLIFQKGSLYPTMCLPSIIEAEVSDW